MNVTSGRVLTSAEKIIQPKRPISQRKPRVILAATGCLCAARFPTICRCFLEWAEVAAVFTNSSLHFIDIPAIPYEIPLYTDNEDWPAWRRVNGQALHLELQNWADLMIIAPLSANTLAKITTGFCDNLLTCIVRGWDYSKPLYIAPSMNDLMWHNIITEQQIYKAYQLGIRSVMPISRRLVSGVLVVGLMAEPDHIYHTVRSNYTFFPRNQRRSDATF